MLDSNGDGNMVEGDGDGDPAGSHGISCIVADDHPAVLDSVSRLLRAEGLDVVGEVSDGDAALVAIRETEPTIALLDLRMPRKDGIEVARQIQVEGLGTLVVLYTGFGDESHLISALEAGVRGFLVKDAHLEELARAIHTVAGGRPYVDASLGARLLSAGSRAARPLTVREREVLCLLADGLTTDAVGRRLFIASETVRTHVRNAMGKLEADTKTEAVATALRRSLIS
jgi:two-component system, NarL family, nitrate/nitrite response regulator NarL